MAASSKALAVRSLAQQEREFLPAALEIMETPASPVGRAIGAAIIALLILALAWAIFGRVEIVATASGKVVTSGRSKILQPLEPGIIRAIHVQNGDAVKAGDVLVELDATESQADSTRLAGELLSARLEAARLEAMLSANPDPQSAFIPPAEADPAQIALTRRFIDSAMADFNAKIAELDRQAAREDANRHAVSATIEKIQTELPILREQLEMRRTLFERNVGSKLAYLDAQERVVESERELPVQQSRLTEAEASAAAALEARHKAEAEQRSGWLAALADAQAKAASLSQELVKADQHRLHQVLLAPIDGVVQQLAVHTIGGVVKTADTLLVLVPTDSPLEVEAAIASADIGFVHDGQPAKIKVDSFPFTRYGLIDGKLLSVSPDSMEIENGAEASNGAEPRGREPVFMARVALDRSAIVTGDQVLRLKPGMAVTVEIDTGMRRIIDYLLSPLVRHTEESMTER
jgi:membrane fusion protein, hemolysin D